MVLTVGWVKDLDEDPTTGDAKYLYAKGGVAGRVMLLPSSGAGADSTHHTIPVSGHGVDLAGEAILHFEENTPTGVVKRLTEIVRLEGDLTGYVLYQATQVFDSAAKTLIVTGHNVFSGTIAGSAPIMLHSDDSRFEVNLATGEENGRVQLTSSSDIPDSGMHWRCDLVVVGTGQSPEGNPTFDYRGVCTRRDR